MNLSLLRIRRCYVFVIVACLSLLRIFIVVLVAIVFFFFFFVYKGQLPMSTDTIRWRKEKLQKQRGNVHNQWSTIQMATHHGNRNAKTTNATTINNRQEPNANPMIACIFEGDEPNTVR